MNITSKEHGLLKGAERIVTSKNVTPDMAMKAARFLMAYSRMIEARTNNNPNEHQMDISEIASSEI